MLLFLILFVIVAVCLVTSWNNSIKLVFFISVSTEVSSWLVQWSDNDCTFSLGKKVLIPQFLHHTFTFFFFLASFMLNVLYLLSERYLMTFTTSQFTILLSFKCLLRKILYDLCSSGRKDCQVQIDPFRRIKTFEDGIKTHMSSCLLSEWWALFSHLRGIAN